MNLKPIPGFPDYTIYEDGLIVSHKYEFDRIIAKTENKQGYITVGLHGPDGPKTRRLHRLLGQAFIPNPMKLPYINHIDGNKQNNSLVNLEWVTAADNTQHAERLGLIRHKSGDSRNHAKLLRTEIALINVLRNIQKASDIAEILGISKYTVYSVWYNKDYEKFRGITIKEAMGD